MRPYIYGRRDDWKFNATIYIWSRVQRVNVSSNNGFTTTKGTSSWVDVLLSDVKITYQLTDPDQLAVQSEQIPPEKTTIVTHQWKFTVYLRELYSPLPCDQPEAWLWYPEDQTLSSAPRPSEWPSMLLQMPATMRKEAQWWEMFLLPVLPSIVREVLGKSRKHIGRVVCIVFQSCSWCNG